MHRGVYIMKDGYGGRGRELNQRWRGVVSVRTFTTEELFIYIPPWIMMWCNVM